MAEAGFSEEEIAAIHSKRAESRLRSTRSIYSLNVGRSASPSSTTRLHNGPMRRDQSDASLSQVSLASSQHSYGSRSHIRKVSTSSRGLSEYSASGTDHEPRGMPPTRPTPTHSFTYPMLHSQSTPHLPTHYTNSSMTRVAPPIPPLPPPATSVISDNSSNSGLSEKQLMARNAPSRAYHVANESVCTISHSPPPAYMSPKKESLIAQLDEDFRLPPSVLQPVPGSSATVDGSSRPSAESNNYNMISNGISSTSPLLPTPPRLSFHQDDLSSWTESLFSSIPTSVTLTPPKPSMSRTQTNTPQIGESDFSRSRAASVRTRDRSGSASLRQIPPQKPLPRQEPPPPAVRPPSPPPQSSSPLWNEVMHMVKPEDASSSMWSQDTSADMSSDSRYSSQLLSPVLDEFPPIPRITDPDGYDFQSSLAREKENRDSGLSTMTVTPATIATAAVARSVRPNMVVSPVRANSGDDNRATIVVVSKETEDSRSQSPGSAESHSSRYSSDTTASLSTGTGSTSSDSRPQTLTTSETQDWAGKPKSLVYSDPSPEPSPRVQTFGERETFTVSVTDELREPDVDILSQPRPSIVTDVTDSLLTTRRTDGKLLTPVSPSSSTPSPASPAPRYPGWLSAIVAPLKGFINDQLDPRDLYADLREIAEGESGSVYAARVLPTPTSPEKEPDSYVAIKNIAIMPSGTPKIDDLRKELTIMKGLSHPHILTMDSLYVDLQEDSLWIRMELMERSLADVIALVEDGILLDEKVMAQMAGDVSNVNFRVQLSGILIPDFQVLQALSYLQSKGIAHRDVRSDNLLINQEGVVKLADFSSAVQVTKQKPTCTDPAGVVYWQAPEIRR